MTEPLLLTALTVAFVHTLIGIDHTLPFVVLGQARRWSVAKVAAITALCGVAHVTGSVALGFVGIGAGVAIGRLEWIESVRGSLASWGLIAFGLVYLAWAVTQYVRKQRHTHVHAHHDGAIHVHEHNHQREHLHAHEAVSLTFWGLFLVFALGPCEPLIPVLMAPAFEEDWWMVTQVAVVFSVTTIGTMVAIAVLGTLGLSLAPLERPQRYANIAAGAAIVVSGLAIQIFGI